MKIVFNKKFVSFFVVLFVGIFFGNSFADDRPTKLNEIAEKNNCIPLGDEPDHKLKTKPWWIDISRLTGDKGDFVFYCRSKQDKETFRLVIYISGDKNPWAGCPTKIDDNSVWPYPTSLSVVKPEGTHASRISFSKWRTNSREYGDANVKFTKPFIDTTGDIAGEMYYCHNGKWFEFSFH